VYPDWRLTPCSGPIRIRMLDPITPAEVDGSADGLREQSYRRISQTLMALRTLDDKEQRA